MKAAELRIAVQEAKDGYDILALDPDCDGGCPCFWVHGEDFEVHGHCWRTTNRWDGHTCGHRYVALHLRIDPAYGGVGHTTARHLTALDWYGEWPVEFHAP